LIWQTKKSCIHNINIITLNPKSLQNIDQTLFGSEFYYFLAVMQMFTRQTIQSNSSHSTGSMGLDLIIQLMLALAGDIESNPGPICHTSEDPVEKLQDIVEVQGDKVIDMKEDIDKQNKAMQEMLITLNEISTKMDEIKADNDKQPEEITVIGKSIEEERKSSIEVVKKLIEEDSKIDEELDQQRDALKTAQACDGDEQD